MTSRAQSSFEKLPGEIRMRIYRFVLHVEAICMEPMDLTTYSRPSTPNDSRPSELPARPRGDHPEGHVRRLSTAYNFRLCYGGPPRYLDLVASHPDSNVLGNAHCSILRVCKLIHLEATRIFYGENVFTVGQELMEDFNKAFLRHLSERSRNFIRRLHIKWDIDSMFRSCRIHQLPLLGIILNLQSLRQITFSVTPYQRCQATVPIEPSVETNILATGLLEVANYDYKSLPDVLQSDPEFSPFVFLDVRRQVSIFRKPAALNLEEKAIMSSLQLLQPLNPRPEYFALCKHHHLVGSPTPSGEVPLTRFFPMCSFRSIKLADNVDTRTEEVWDYLSYDWYPNENSTDGNLYETYRNPMYQEFVITKRPT